MKFAVMSDIHYISEEMMLEQTEPKYRLKHAVSKAALDTAAGLEDIDTILITGDLTNDGDAISHDELVRLLRDVKAKGKRVYVLTATHDYRFNRSYTVKHGASVKYNATPWDLPWFDKDSFDYKTIVHDEFKQLSAEQCVPPLEKVYCPTELWEVYREFGRDDAISVCEQAYSYCVELDKNTWCLMLNDGFRDVDAMRNTSATYSPECYRWIESMVKQARQKGIFIFACTHHPLVPPVPGYKIGGTDRNMRSAVICHILADIGIPLVFSGHTHFADVAFGSSDRGNILCNITTPSACFLPPQFRTAQLDAAQGKISLRSIPVPVPEGINLTEKTLKEHYTKEFIEEYRHKISAMKPPLNKIIMGATVKKLYPLCRGACGMTREEYMRIKGKSVFDILIAAAVNMQCGDGEFTPDTPEYKFMMGMCAFIDSIISTQPFKDLSGKLKGYSVSQIVEPMLFNNYIPDNDADFDFTKLPEPRVKVPELKSCGGDVLMTVLWVLAVPLSVLAPVITAAALPVAVVKKKKRLKASPIRPERY